MTFKPRKNEFTLGGFLNSVLRDNKSSKEKENKKKEEKKSNEKNNSN